MLKIGPFMNSSMNSQHNYVQSLALCINSQLQIQSATEPHDYLGEPTLTDAILDILLQNVYRVEIAGESMRKAKKVESA
jgi:hypothetical protein